VLLSWVTTLAGAQGNQFLGTVLGGNPFQLTIGASGAVFGLMGAAMVGCATAASTRGARRSAASSRSTW
jgi:hypothetical protein